MYPISYVHLEITGRCNFSCKYCYNTKYRDIPNELSTKEIKSIIDQLISSGGNFFVISGGEPFIRGDLFEILYYLKSKNLPVRILTNGSLLSKKIINRIKKEGLIDEFRVSLDSSMKEDLNRGFKYKEIVSNLKYISNLGIPLVINTVLTEQTYRNLLSLYDQIKTLKVSQWRIDLPFIHGSYKKNIKELSIKDDEELFKQFAKLIRKYLQENPSFTMDIVYVFRTKIIKSGIFEHNLNMHPCEYMKDSITIRPNGDVCFCPTLPIVFGNVRKKTLQEILKSKKRKRFMDLSIKDIKKCVKCRYLKICGGGCRADAYFESKNLKKEDKRFCKFMPLFEKYILKCYPKKVQESLRRMIVC